MMASRPLTIAALVIATESHAGAIRGRLDAAPETSAGGTQVAATLTDAVVWVDTLPAQAMRRYRGKSREARITQQGRRFSPRVTAVAAGSPIRFSNRDNVYHNVFSVSPSKRFDLGKYPPRTIHRVTFDRPGLVNLYCDIHPGMAAYVMVLPHRVFARPAASGRFALPELPAGSYVVKAWHPVHGERTTHVEVPRRGVVVTRLRF